MIKLFCYADYCHVNNVRHIFEPSIIFARDNGFIMKVTDHKDDYSYWKALREVWNKDDLINLEHDVLPTQEQLEELEKCKEDLCTFVYDTDNINYKGYNANVNMSSVWNYSYFDNNRVPDPKQFVKIYDENIKYSQGSVFGFIKISKKIQNELDEFMNTPIRWFEGIDSVISYQTAKLGYKWHIHRYVTHNHKEDFRALLGY